MDVFCWPFRRLSPIASSCSQIVQQHKRAGKNLTSCQECDGQGCRTLVETDGWTTLHAAGNTCEALFWPPALSGCSIWKATSANSSPFCEPTSRSTNYPGVRMPCIVSPPNGSVCTVRVSAVSATLPTGRRESRPEASSIWAQEAAGKTQVAVKGIEKSIQHGWSGVLGVR